MPHGILFPQHDVTAEQLRICQSIYEKVGNFQSWLETAAAVGLPHFPAGDPPADAILFFLRIPWQNVAVVAVTLRGACMQRNRQILGSQAKAAVARRIPMSESENHSAEGMDDNRFVAMLTASQPNLRAFILSMTPSPGDADDLLQEANMALWAKRERFFDLDIEFIRWALGFVTLEVLKHRRRAANSRLWLGEEAIEKLAAEWQQNDFFAEDCHAALRGCISKLPHAQRSVIEDKYIRMQTTKQIAVTSGRPLSTIYKIVNRALVSLRECVERSNRRLDH